MKKVTMLLAIFFINTSMLFAIPETAWIQSLTIQYNQYDCNDIEFTVTGLSAHYHWFFTADWKIYKWNGSSYEVAPGDRNIDYDFPYDNEEHSWSLSSGTYRIESILENGNYYIEVSVHTNDAEYSKIAYFTVNDNTAPATPTNVATSWSSDHPHLSWSANTEIDLQYYEVWKKRTPAGSWSLKATTTNTSYTDGSEIQFSSPPKETVYYKICAVDFEENKSSFTSEESFLVNAWQQNILAFTEISDIKLSDYQLFSNYPNPFNPDTKISFGLPEQSIVNLDVYDVSGKKVANLINGNQQAGMYTATFNAQNLPSGVYIYKLNAKGIENGKSFNDVRRMLLIK